MNYDNQFEQPNPEFNSINNEVQPLPNSFRSRIQQYLSYQYRKPMFLELFIFFTILFLIIYFLYHFLCKNKDQMKLKTLKREYAPFLDQKSIKKSDALVVSDNHSIHSDDYEDFLRYKMMKNRQMEAQKKKQNKLKSNKKLVNYHLLNSDPMRDYKRMTKEQITKLARKERNCLIDLNGIENNKILNDKYQNRIKSSV